MNTKLKQEKRDRRRKRIRAKVSGTADKPRLSVFKSNRYISAQIIDDISGKTLCASTSQNMKAKTMRERAEEVGADLAKQAKEKKIEKVVFDRGGYIYVGSIQALAEGARKAGLKF